MLRRSTMRQRESKIRKSDLDLIDSSTKTASDFVQEASEPQTETDVAPSSLKVSGPLPIEQFTKHQVLTEKAKMNLKPHAPVACQDYKTMVREETEFKNRPEWDSSKHFFVRDMIESQRNIVIAKDLLKKLHKEQELTRKEKDKEIENLMNEQKAFGASFINFDTIVKENLEKKERAVENLKAERAVQVDMNEQLTRAETTLEKLTKIKDDMLTSIADRKVFVDYLEDVRAMAPNQYSNGVHQIAERFELLLQAREQLAEEHAQSVIKTQELVTKMFEITDKRAEQMVNLKNKITEMYSRYNAAKQETLEYEFIVDKVEEITARKTRQQTRIKNSCWNLYNKICENHAIPVKLQRHQVKEQLAVIEKTILTIRRAVFLVRKKKETFSDASLSHVPSKKTMKKK